MSTDGITNVAGMRKPTMTVGDKTYTLSPTTIDSLGEVENYILAERAVPHEIVAALPLSTPPHIVKMWVESAMHESTIARFVSAEEMASYDDSPRGMAHKFMLHLRPEHPEINSVEATLPILEALLNAGRVKELQAKMDEASSDDKLKNSDGRAKMESSTSPAKSDPGGTDDQTECPGPKSTEDLQTAMAGSPGTSDG